METEVSYVIQVSNNNRHWGTSHHAMSSFPNLKDAEELANRAEEVYGFVRILKQTITLEAVEGHDD